jgi:hypothetical protein
MNRAPDAPLDKVEWRVDGKPMERDGKTMSRFVPYLDAPTVAGLFDEWAGSTGWSDSYRVVDVLGKPALECTIRVVGSDGETWVAKTDVGVASNFEPQKGAFSDAFKRCASIKWGVGRNVYDLPTLVAPCRVTKRPGKDDQAWPTGETMPSILKQLKALGFDAEGGRVAEPDQQHDDEPLDQPADPDAWFRANGWDSKAHHDEYRTSIRERVTALNEEARRQLGNNPLWESAKGRAWDAATANTVEAIVSDLEQEEPL